MHYLNFCCYVLSLIWHCIVYRHLASSIYYLRYSCFRNFCVSYHWFSMFISENIPLIWLMQAFPKDHFISTGCVYCIFLFLLYSSKSTTKQNKYLTYLTLTPYTPFPFLLLYSTESYPVIVSVFSLFKVIRKKLRSTQAEQLLTAKKCLSSVIHFRSLADPWLVQNSLSPVLGQKIFINI